MKLLNLLIIQIFFMKATVVKNGNLSLSFYSEKSKASKNPLYMATSWGRSSDVFWHDFGFDFQNPNSDSQSGF
jgi:hypothetical protein